jgi:probable HAF family extracellular repeat protein
MRYSRLVPTLAFLLAIAACQDATQPDAQPEFNQSQPSVTTSTTGIPISDLGLGQAVLISRKGHVVIQEGDQVRLWRKGTMTDLGPGEAAAINDEGHVVGSSGDRAALWKDGEMIDLGTLGGTRSRALDINSPAGEVVGWSQTATGETHAFYWNNHTMIDVGTLGGTSSRATAINKFGEVVGFSTTEVPQQVMSFHWEKGVLTKLPSLFNPPNVRDIMWRAYDISDRRPVAEIAGVGGVIDPKWFVIWENGTVADAIRHWSPAGATVMEINERGQVMAGNHSALMGWLWSDGRLFGLVGGRGEARAINDRGHVVGWGQIFGEPRRVGTALWCASNLIAGEWDSPPVLELGHLQGDSYSQAFDINNRGQVVGSSGTSAGDEHAVLWTLRPNVTEQFCRGDT